ncbi:MAG: 1-acyl-sn-glycerol-3-phosphate acyltransferase [Pirellulaceae bacterium]|nr:1-acyl-sn-glycerol-3-phosphate acyltransferase [Pirellulaceae bacterium]
MQTAPWHVRLTGLVLAFAAKLLSGASARWRHCQPDSCQRIYFANHTSHLDALVIWSALPRAMRSLVRPVAAADYWASSSIKRYAASSFNAMLIDRKDVKVHRNPINVMLEQMGDTYSIIVFPEGGRSLDGQMQKFKSGLYHLGKKRPDIELVPVYIDNVNRVLPRGEFLPVPLLSSITFGEPIWLENGESKNDFLNRAHQAVLSLKDR